MRLLDKETIDPGGRVLDPIIALHLKALKVIKPPESSSILGYR